MKTKLRQLVLVVALVCAAGAGYGASRLLWWSVWTLGCATVLYATFWWRLGHRSQKIPRLTDVKPEVGAIS